MMEMQQRAHALSPWVGQGGVRRGLYALLLNKNESQPTKLLPSKQKKQKHIQCIGTAFHTTFTFALLPLQHFVIEKTEYTDCIKVILGH
jgi:hypothetical protein